MCREFGFESGWFQTFTDFLMRPDLGKVTLMNIHGVLQQKASLPEFIKSSNIQI